MVVRFNLTNDANEGDGNIQAKTATQKGGLVSRRVEMYEPPQPRNSHHRRPPPSPASRKTYHRPTDSFRVKLVASEEMNNNEETRQEEPKFEDSVQSGAQEEPREAEKAKTTCLKDYVGAAIVENGVDLYKKGEYEQALKAFATALKTQRVSVGNEQLCISLTLANMGATYLQLEKYREAESALEESLAIKKAIASGMLLADTLNNLGNCANLRGNYEKSLAYYLEAIDDLQEKSGDNEDIADTLFNIGRMEVQERQWDLALKSLEEACRIGREVHGSHHAFISETMDLIGFVHLSTSDFDRAMVSFTSALAIHRRLHGPMHVEVANSLLNVGMVRDCKGDLAEAWEAYTIASDLYTRLKVRKDFPAFVATRESIEKVERTIAKQNQQKLIQKHKKARAAFQKRTKSAKKIAEV